MMIGSEIYDTYTEFKEDLSKHIKNITLGNQKVKVTGNPVAFFETEEALSSASKSKNFDRSEFDKARADRARRKIIEVLNRLSSTEREKVLSIDEKIQERQEVLDDLLRTMEEGTSSTKAQQEQKKELTVELQALVNEKVAITKDVVKEIILEQVDEVQDILDDIYKKDPRVIKQ